MKQRRLRKCDECKKKKKLGVEQHGKDGSRDGRLCRKCIVEMTGEKPDYYD